MQRLLPHRIAIVGGGLAAGLHIRSLRELQDRTEVAAFWSPSERRRAETARRYGLPEVRFLNEIFDDPTIDILLVLAPPVAHFDLVRFAAAAGKHVLVEKPIDLTVERATVSIELMERAGRQMGVVLQNRYRPASQRLRALVENDDFGQILSASASVRWWRSDDYYAEKGRGTRARDGGGVLLTQAIHTIDLLLNVAGPVRKLHAFALNSGLRTTDTEDVVAACLAFEGGALGILEATTVAFPGSPERVEIAGTRASALLSGGALTVFHKDGRTEEIDDREPVDAGNPNLHSHGAHKALITDFLDAIDSERQFFVHARSALAPQQLIEDLLSSAGWPGTHGTVIM